VTVSSDSKAILETAADFGATHLIKHPDELAYDSAPKLLAVRHCVLEVESSHHEFDIDVDIDATSPPRNIEDILGCLTVFRDFGCPHVIAGCVSRHSLHFNMVEVQSDGTMRLSKTRTPTPRRRQDTPPTYYMSTSIYGWRHDALLASEDAIRPKIRLYVISEGNSLVDTGLDS